MSRQADKRPNDMGERTGGCCLLRLTNCVQPWSSNSPNRILDMVLYLQVRLYRPVFSEFPNDASEDLLGTDPIYSKNGKDLMFYRNCIQLFRVSWDEAYVWSQKHGRDHVVGADGLDQDWDSLQSEAAASIGCPKKEAMNFWLVNLPPQRSPPPRKKGFNSLIRPY